MATLIRLKRKVSSGNNGITLKRGEPYYNISDKHLYVGNENDEQLTNERKHITQITSVEGKELSPIPGENGEIVITPDLDKDPWEGKDTVEFYIGEDTNNSYKKVIEYVEKSHIADFVRTGCISNIQYDARTDTLTITETSASGSVQSLIQFPKTLPLQWKTF